MKILLSCLLILMLFADSSLATYESFFRKHIDKDMTDMVTMVNNKCDSVIKDKNIYDNNNCKRINTFIASDLAEVEKICTSEGTLNSQSQMMQSKKMFTLINCKLKDNNAKKPNCQYEGILLTNRKLLVQCDNNNRPVHFGENSFIILCFSF
uniref:Ribonuclease A-domain domain-containing protein n=1 Tax=Oryzias latipes TaxID=8090 RepID=A0A3P9HU44_ORYLA